MIALALLTLQKEQSAALQTVAMIGLAVFVVAAAGIAVHSAARPLRRQHARAWTGDSFVRFRNEAVGLLRHRWHVLTLATLAGQLSVFVVLLVSLRVLDVSASEVSSVEAFAAWSLVRLLGSVPINARRARRRRGRTHGRLVGFGPPT